MRNPKYSHCNTCGEQFEVSKDTLDLVNEGYAQMPRICDDCDYDGSDIYETHSDADPGL